MRRREPYVGCPPPGARRSCPPARGRTRQRLGTPGLFHGFDRTAWVDGSPADRLVLLPAAQVIEELIGIARELRAAGARGETLGLTDDELAFYDALGVNDSAVQVLGDETLRDIARELVETVRGNVTIDWTLRENVRANLRRLVKRVLRRHGYPPDRQEAATLTVLEHAEVLSAGWASSGIGGSVGPG